MCNMAPAPALVSVIGRMIMRLPLLSQDSHGDAELATASGIAIGRTLHARASGREASGPPVADLRLRAQASRNFELEQVPPWRSPKEKLRPPSATCAAATTR